MRRLGLANRMWRRAVTGLCSTRKWRQSTAHGAARGPGRGGSVAMRPSPLRISRFARRVRRDTCAAH